MEYLSIENFQLLSKILVLNLNPDDEPKKKLLFHIMTFIAKQNKDVLESNKLTVYFFTKLSKQKFQPLENLPVSEDKWVYISKDRNNYDSLIKGNQGLTYLQDIYRKTNDYYQNFEIPDGIQSSEFLIEKSEHLKNLEDALFNEYQYEQVMVFDSRDRNHDNYPNPEEYRINFHNIMRNVHTIEVLSAEIPKSGYTINENNNTIYFQEENGVENILSASIPEGNYNVTEIRGLLQSAMNVSGSSVYTITEVDNRIKISSDLTAGDNIFILKFNGGTEFTLDGRTRSVYYKNNIGPVLGYLRNDLSGSSNYIATHSSDTTGIKGLYMTLKNLPYSRYYANDGFIKINMNCNIGEVCYYKNQQFSHYFKPMLNSIEFLDIRWTDYYDNIYSFNGLDHSITIKFIGYTVGN